MRNAKLGLWTKAITCWWTFYREVVKQFHQTVCQDSITEIPVSLFGSINKNHQIKSSPPKCASILTQIQETKMWNKNDIHTAFMNYVFTKLTVEVSQPERCDQNCSDIWGWEDKTDIKGPNRWEKTSRYLLLWARCDSIQLRGHSWRCPPLYPIVWLSCRVVHMVKVPSRLYEGKNSRVKGVSSTTPWDIAAGALLER